MELLRFNEIARHYGANDVFTGLSGVIRDGMRIALVGPNGAGKSSLVRILVGAEAPDGGSLNRARETHLGYLAQDAAEANDQTLGEAFAAALDGGRAHEWEMRATLNRFNFTNADLDRPLAEFSGGQRTRALLARTLLENPDWLVLDEPTNHLDLETVRWLETFVADDSRAYLIVSHDRFFIETVATHVWELDRGELAVFEVKPGQAYTSYLEQRALRRADQQRQFEAAQAERKRQRAAIDELKTHGSHNYSHVRSREKALARVTEADAPRSERREIAVALTAARRATTGFALEVSGVSMAYDRPLFTNFSAAFARGDRVAIVGPNGAGKSTFLRIINGELTPDAGSIRYGTGLTMASYSQSSADDLTPGDTAAQAVMRMGVTDEEARGYLGRLNLGGDSGDKPVAAFSGGERRRIMLARLMAQRADCLFLDEPTNDLDIPSREALEDVLASYDGALFVVSHDRYLLKRLARRVLAIADGTATIIDGDYETYERIQHQTKTAAKSKTKGEPKRGGSSNKGKSKANGSAGSGGGSSSAHANGGAAGTKHSRSSSSAGYANGGTSSGHQSSGATSTAADHNGGSASAGKANPAASRAAHADGPIANATKSNGAGVEYKLDKRAAHEAKLDLGRRKRAVTDAEKRVADLDRQRAEIELQFTAPDVYDDPQTVVSLGRELDRLRAESEAAMHAWEAAVAALETFEPA